MKPYGTNSGGLELPQPNDGIYSPSIETTGPLKGWSRVIGQAAPDARRPGGADPPPGVARAPHRDWKLEAVDVEDYSEAAREIGRFSAVAGEKPVSGKYVVVWTKRDDGAWRLASDIWKLNEN